MNIKICHISDTHDCPNIALGAAREPVDVIVLSGDLMANRGRIGGLGILPDLERIYQTNWVQGSNRIASWAKAFGETPVVIVDGNHDFISMANPLRDAGCNVYHITAENPCITVAGVRFAGFREIPWIAGEWMGETHNQREAIDRAFDCDPQILVTHGPPAGILDGPNGYGSAPLTTALAYRGDRIKAHLFGHAHEGCGMAQTMGISFSNAAGVCRVIEVAL